MELYTLEFVKNILYGLIILNMFQELKHTRQIFNIKHVFALLYLHLPRAA